ncbi:MAG TPA: HAMP domain-containing sensor histidine kinase [Puia sp.]|nr:HAMP domain-containing sensor histidine kinase [Puia sp.]
MKLISKYNRINVLATIGVLLVASVSYYFIVRYVLTHQLDNTLKVEEAEILSFVKTNNRLPAASNYRDQHTSFSIVDKPFRREFSNIEICHVGRHSENDEYRQLAFPVQIGGTIYKATVTKSEEEIEDLVWLIVEVTLAVVALLLVILFVANRLLLRKIWQPFYRTLESIKSFNLSNKTANRPEMIKITEFNELNNAVSVMQSRIIRDYETLKNFADNASHEMQTPLAILNSKLDLLIQEQSISESQTRHLQAMYDALGRLSKLNQSLLLLTKIENNQFTQINPVRIDTLVRKKLVQLEDFIHAKHLQVRTNLHEMIVKMDDYLADILLNNLLSNAVRHNQQDGSIDVLVSQHEIVISNTGPRFEFDDHDIFERFKKTAQSEGVGLGLAIAKQICDNYQFGLDYSFRDNRHRFQVHVNNPD